MADAQLERYRRMAKKLKNPTPVELPSGNFQCQVTVNGERVSVVNEDPRAAHAEARALKAELMEAKKKPAVLTLNDAITRYIEKYEASLSPATVRGYLTAQKHRFPELMKMDIHSIRVSDLQCAIDHEKQTVSAKTIYKCVRFGSTGPQRIWH